MTENDKFNTIQSYQTNTNNNNNSTNNLTNSSFYKNIQSINRKDSTYTATMRKKQEKEKNKAIIDNDDPSKVKIGDKNYNFNNINTDPVLIIQEKLRKGIIDYNELPDLKELFNERIITDKGVDLNKLKKTIGKIKLKKENPFDLEAIIKNREEMLLYEPDDDKDQLNKDILNVKYLNQWDDNWNMKNKPEASKFKNNDNDALKLINDIKTTMTNTSLLKNRHLADFCKQTETEISIILMMNINISKQKFKFDEFKALNDNKSITKKGSNWRDSINSSNLKTNRSLKKNIYNSLKLSIKKGLINNTSSIQNNNMDNYENEIDNIVTLFTPKFKILPSPSPKKQVKFMRNTVKDSFLDKTHKNQFVNTNESLPSVINLNNKDMDVRNINNSNLIINSFMIEENIDINKAKSLYFKHMYKSNNQRQLNIINNKKTKKNKEVKESALNDELLAQKFKHLSVTIKEGDDYAKIDESVIKNNNFQFNQSFYKFSNIDKYRIIIKDRIKIEQGNRKELIRLSSLIYQKKILKRSIDKEVNTLTSQLKELRGQLMLKIDVEKSKIRQENDKFNKMLLHPSFSLKEAKTDSERNDIKKRIRLYTELHNKTVEEVEVIIEGIKKDYNIKIKPKVVELDNCNKRQELINKEVELIKSALMTNTLDQRQYYLNLLSQGYDVRLNGIEWIIKRLIELNYTLDKSIFPKFLDEGQVEFLVNLSYSKTELCQLKVLLSIIKKKQKELAPSSILNKNLNLNETNHHEDYFKLTKEHLNDENITNKEEDVNIKRIREKIQEKTKLISKKTLNLLNLTNKDSHFQTIEDVYIQTVVDYLKSKLQVFNKTHDRSILNDVNILGLSTISNTNHIKYTPLYFNEILNLRHKIDEFEKEIELIIQTEMTFFKERYDNLKLINPKHSFQYDLIYAAMFGNGIVV